MRRRGTSTPRGRAQSGSRRGRPARRRTARALPAAGAGRSPRSAWRAPLLRRLAFALHRDAGRHFLERCLLSLRGIGLDGVLARLDRFDFLDLVGLGLAAGAVGAGALERLVRRDAAEARTGQCGVRAALAVREDRRAAAGDVLALLA